MIKQNVFDVRIDARIGRIPEPYIGENVLNMSSADRSSVLSGELRISAIPVYHSINNAKRVGTFD